MQSCEEGELRVEKRSTFGIAYYVIQVCSNVTGSLDWTYICYGSNWDVDSVNVYCKQLGYMKAKDVSSTDSGSYRTTLEYLNGILKIDNIDCDGDEKTLLNCDFVTTESRCRLTEYNPTSHCTNETALPIDPPVSSATVSSISDTKFPVVSSSVSPPISTMDSPVAIPAASSSSSAYSPVVSTSVSPPISTMDSPVAIPAVSSSSSTYSPVVSSSVSPPISTMDSPVAIPAATSSSSAYSPIVSSSVSPPISITELPGGDELDSETKTRDMPHDTTSAPDTNSSNPPVDTVSHSPLITSNSQSETTPTESPTTDLVTSPLSLQIIIPVVAVAIFGAIFLLVLVVISVLCCYSRLRRRKLSNLDSEYYTMPVLSDSTDKSCVTSVQQYSNDMELSGIQNGNIQFMTSNIYASISEDYKTNMEYAEVAPTRLNTEYVETLHDAPIYTYYVVDNGLYGSMVEGEVGDYDIYSALPGMSPLAAYEVPNSILNNPYANGDSPLFVEPPDNLPDLENVFGHCMHEIDRKEIDLQKEFASGQFGVVYRAVYHTQRGDIPVAIKTLKETSDTDTKVAFMREAAILAQFQHPNVLRLIGVLTAQQPYMMVTELLKTELREFLGSVKTSGLYKTEDISPLFLKFSIHISAGMQHLSDKHFIHRDLAARNVLVAKDLSCRIADFGMSRELISDSEYYTSSGGRVPLRWTAPEAIFYKKYSEKSDVWSFGMTLFEIWSLGEKPWGKDATNEEIIEGLSEGRKLSPPTGCPRDVYSVMVETWRMDASSRPTFSTILHLLTNIRLSTAPPLSPETDPSLCLGNDLVLSKHHFTDLQKLY